MLFLMLRVVIAKIKVWVKRKESMSAGVREFLKKLSRNMSARAGLIYSDATRMIWQS